MPNRVPDTYARTELLHGLAQALRDADYENMADADLLALTVFLGGRVKPSGNLERRGLYVV